MLPRGEQLLNRSRSFQHHSQCEDDNGDTGNGGDVMVAGSHMIVLQFLKSGFVNNPVIVS